MKTDSSKGKDKKKVRMSLFVSSELKTRLSHLAEKNERSMGFVAEKLIEGKGDELKQAA